MRYLIIISLWLSSITSFSQEERESYIKNYAKIAVKEMHLYKIPSSITLAQGILESAAGTSELAQNAFNHFGIKCKKEWTGKEYYKVSAEYYGGRKTRHESCFRAYEKVEESFEDHSKFLAHRPYYKNLFKLDLQDYRGWAYGLRKAGYATDPKYAQLLISIIEKYNLHEFDSLKPEEVDAKLAERYGESEYLLANNKQKNEKSDTENIKQKEIVNPTPPKKEIVINKPPLSPTQRLKKHAIGRDYVVVKKDETLAQFAKWYNISLLKLIKYNELDKSGSLVEGQYLFLGKKKNRGKQKYYKVKEGETMYIVAQKMGIKINKLYKLNNLSPGTQPKEGTVLNIRTRKKGN